MKNPPPPIPPGADQRVGAGNKMPKHTARSRDVHQSFSPLFFFFFRPLLAMTARERRCERGLLSLSSLSSFLHPLYPYTGHASCRLFPDFSFSFSLYGYFLPLVAVLQGRICVFGEEKERRVSSPFSLPLHRWTSKRPISTSWTG